MTGTVLFLDKRLPKSISVILNSTIDIAKIEITMLIFFIIFLNKFNNFQALPVC